MAAGAVRVTATPNPRRSPCAVPCFSPCSRSPAPPPEDTGTTDSGGGSGATDDTASNDEPMAILGDDDVLYYSFDPETAQRLELDDMNLGFAAETITLSSDLTSNIRQFTVEAFDNGAGWVEATTAFGHTTEGDWAKWAWHRENGQLFLCMVQVGADRDDLDAIVMRTGNVREYGCPLGPPGSGAPEFPWMKATPQPK